MSDSSSTDTDRLSAVSPAISGPSKIETARLQARRDAFARGRAHALLLCHQARLGGNIPYAQLQWRIATSFRSTRVGEA